MEEVLLVGGLGNQLFQYAYALSLKSQGLNVSLTYNQKLTKLDSSGRPHLLSYQIVDGIRVHKEESPHVIAIKIRNLILRLNSISSNKERPYRDLFTKVLAKLYYRLTKVQICVENQFNRLGEVTTKRIHLGYFQNLNYVDSKKVKSHLKLISLEKKPEILKYYSLEAAEQRPLVIHIRAGDYMSDDKIGVLPLEYFTEAIASALENQMYGALWFFSDSPEYFKNSFGAWNQIPQYWIDPPDTTPAELLEIMKLGSGFIISNSTFSWWAAFLAKQEIVKVYAPAKWFKNLTQPEKICPPAWVRVRSW
jgi:hypothetical protein